MKKLHLLTLLVAVLAVFGAASAQAAKVNVCHLPPGNPDNWHTITISENALSAHLAHGDLGGTCDANCEYLCDDEGNACTQDVDPQGEDCECLAEPRPAVDCSDGLFCTTDTCDPAEGCVRTDVVCDPPDLCTVSECSEYDEGACVDTPVVCAEGTSCDLDTGVCEPSCVEAECQNSPDGCTQRGCVGGMCEEVFLSGVSCDSCSGFECECQSGVCIEVEGCDCCGSPYGCDCC